VARPEYPGAKQGTNDRLDLRSLPSDQISTSEFGNAMGILNGVERLSSVGEKRR